MAVAAAFARSVLNKGFWFCSGLARLPVPLKSRSLFLPVIGSDRKMRIARLQALSYTFFNLLAVFPENHPVFGQITGRPVRIWLQTPPSSPCKPRVSGTAPNRAFLRGFRPLISRIFVSVSAHPFWWRYLGARLHIQKFRSRRPGSGTKSGRTCSRNSAFCAAVI